MRLEHGGDTKKFAERFGIAESAVLDFSSNVNPFGIPGNALAAYHAMEDELARYPDSRAERFSREVSRHFPVFIENILAGPGSMSLLSLLVRVLAPRRALLIEPCFNEYRRLLNQQGTEGRSVLLREGAEFRFPLTEIINAMRGTDFLLLGHPNNPTGTALSREDMKFLLDEARRRGVFVVIDEAFADWCPEYSLAAEVKDNCAFAVVRSLTKFYGLAGVRAGYVLGARKLIGKLASVQEPWAVSRPAEVLSAAALADTEFTEKTRRWFAEESRWLYRALDSLGTVRVFPSLANFFLLKFRTAAKISSLYEALGSKGIMIRTVRDFAGLDDSYFRIALRLRAENETLIEALNGWAERRDGVCTAASPVEMA